MKKLLLSIGLCLGALLVPVASAQAAPFLATFQTTSANESITLPLIYGETYNFTVDWNDPNDPGTDTITAYDQAERTHSYAVAGTYQISIEGTMPIWNFGTVNASQNQIISIDDAGDVGFGVGVTTFYGMFSSCANLVSVALFDTSSGENFTNMFLNATSLTSAPAFDLSSSTILTNMFKGASALVSVGELYTPLATNFVDMFRGATSLTSITMTDLGSGQLFTRMFLGANSLVTANLNDVSSGVDFTSMFSGASALTTVSDLNTPNGTHFSYMFSGASSLTSITMPDLSSGEIFYNMFSQANSLATINIDGDVTNGTNFARMFYGVAATTLPVLNTPLGTNFSDMFRTASNLTSVTLTDLSNGTNFDRMFTGTNSLTEGVPTGARYNIAYVSTSMDVEALRDVFDGIGVADNSGGQQILEITGNPGVASLTAQDYAVVEAKGWAVVPAYVPTCTDGVQNGDETGVDCGGATCGECQAPFLATFRTTGANESITLPLGSGYAYDFTVDWGDGSDPDTITSYNQAERVHSYATAGDYQISITGNDMQFWSFNVNGGNATSKDQIISLDDAGDIGFSSGVTAFNGMFYDCQNLESVALFDTSAGTNFGYMFYGASSLTSVPLFITSVGADFQYMFSNATSLVTIPTLNTGAGTKFQGMFKGASSLTSVPLINTALGTNFEGMFQGASSLTTVPLINTSGGTNFTDMFRDMAALTSIPLINTGQGVDFAGMFAYSSSLTTIPLLNTSAGEAFNGMFYQATGLTSVPLLDTSAGTVFNNMFLGTSNLIQGALSGTRYNIDYSDATMSVSALRDVFDEIGTADNSGGQQTLDITGNPGVTGLNSLDYAVVQDKGWLVVPAFEPSNTCANLTTAYFEKFFYHDNPQMIAITTALNDYQYYDCDNKIFRIGNESEQMEDISLMLSLRLTTAELNTINSNQTATEGQSYYDTEARVFRRGQADGTLVTVNEDERNLTTAEIAAITTASEGEFYYNITTRMFYIGESDGTLGQLFVQN